MNDLKIGDYLYTQSVYHPLGKVTVVRLTPTQIVLSDNNKLKIPFSGHAAAIGSSGYGNTYYILPTGELDNYYAKLILSRQIKQFTEAKNFVNSHSVETLKNVLELLSAKETAHS